MSAMVRVHKYHSTGMLSIIFFNLQSCKGRKAITKEGLEIYIYNVSPQCPKILLSNISSSNYF
jgi:hypothetical protein